MALTDSTVGARKNGTNVGSNLANSVTITTTETTQTYGGPTSKWGTTWTVADMATLGFRWSGRSTVSGTSTTEFIFANPSFSPSIPAGSTIDGIELRVKLKSAGAGTGTASFSINYVSVTVYYTAAASRSRQSMSGGFNDICVGGVYQ